MAAPYAGLHPYVDASTYILLKCEEANNLAFADASGNARNFTQSATTGANGGSVFVANSSRYLVSNFHGFLAGSGTYTTVTGGEWTVDGWLYLPNPLTIDGGSYNHIMTYRGSGGDIQMQVSLENATRKLAVTWSTAPGTPVTSVANNSIIPFVTFTHFAVVKKLNGAVYDLYFYINGSLKDTITSIAAPGGTIASPTWYLGWGGVASNGHLNCYISSIRFSNAARTDKEIQHAYSRAMISSHGFTQDANTLVAWRMDDSSGTTAVVDTLDTPTHLDVIGTVKPAFTYGIIGPAASGIGSGTAVLLGGNGGGRDFSVSGGDGYFENTTAGVAATALKAEWTAFVLFRPITAVPSSRDQVLVDYSAPADKCLFRIYIAWNGGTPLYRWLWETASATVDGTICPYVYNPAKYICLAVKKTINGGNYDVRTYLNGVFQTTNVAVANAANGTTSYWSVGRQAGTGSTNLISGELDEIFITKQSLTDAAIKTASYNALSGRFGTSLMYDGLPVQKPFGVDLPHQEKLFISSDFLLNPFTVRAIRPGKMVANPSGGVGMGSGNRRGLNSGLE